MTDANTCRCPRLPHHRRDRWRLLKVPCESAKGPRKLTLRLAEIDAPEIRQAFGNRSKQFLASLCLRQPAQVRPLTLGLSLPCSIGAS